MPESLLERSFPRWRLPILLSVLVLILLVPFLLVRQWTEYSRGADAWVAHTLRVEAEAQRLQATIREGEALAIALGAGSGGPYLRERLDLTLGALEPSLDRLVDLTRDNPNQQRLVGRMQVVIARRIEIMRELEGGVAPADYAALVDEMYGRYQVRDLFLQFAQTEQALMAERADYAEVQRLRVRWVSLLALGGQLVLAGIMVWLLQRSERRQTSSEIELRRASARALAVLQTVREPIVLLDGQLRVLMHNTAFSELYADGEDERHERLEDVGDGAWADPVIRQRLSDVLVRDRELWDFEHAQVTMDGQTRTMLVNARRMQLPDRDDDVVLVTVSDISAQKAAQQRIADLNRQLEGKVEQVSEVNRELEAFSYSVSHDLRAPLRHVAGFADKLSRHLGEGVDEKARHYLGVIGNSARRMSSLIDDLLVYSRLGRSALKLQPVDMQSLAEETRAVLDANLAADAADLDQPAHRVEWRLAPLPVVIADENMMRQLWLNLLGNAVKYSAQRERAVIEVEYEPAADGGHHFRVRDNGVGFDMEYAGSLFGVFQRLHKASEYPGTGIGLASVRRVLSRHGGRIWAEAEPDRGATFHFVLPSGQDSVTPQGTTNA